MNPYLDSLNFNSYYPIDHEPEPKEKPKPKEQDATIGKISLILIIAFVAYIIWTIFDAYAYAFDYLDYSGYGVDMNIRYPSDWVYNEYNQGFTLFGNDDKYTLFIPSSEVSLNQTYNTDSDRPAAYVSIGQKLDLPYNNMALDLYFEYMKKLRGENGDNITNTGKIKLSDGSPAYEIDSTSNNTRKSVLVVMTKSPESYYFEYDALPDKFNTYLPIAQEMFKTLSFK